MSHQEILDHHQQRIAERRSQRNAATAELFLAYPDIKAFVDDIRAAFPRKEDISGWRFHMLPGVSQTYRAAGPAYPGPLYKPVSNARRTR